MPLLKSHAANGFGPATVDSSPSLRLAKSCLRSGSRSADSCASVFLISSFAFNNASFARAACASASPRNALAPFSSSGVAARFNAIWNIASTCASTVFRFSSPFTRFANRSASERMNGSFIMVSDCAGTLVTSRRPVVLVGTGASMTVKNGLSRLRITRW